MPSRKDVPMKLAAKVAGERALRGSTVFIAALLLGAMAASVQASAQQSPDKAHFSAPAVAVTYDLERAKIASVGCGCFWLQGGGVDVAVPFYRGLSLAGSFEGGHASNIKPGVNLSKISYLAGPRYTFSGRSGAMSRLQVYGEGLFGGTHAFDGLFPVAGGVNSSANSYAMQFGGGLDVVAHNGFGVRVFEVDYVRTALANNGTNTQNDLRLAFGLSYHFKMK